MAARILVLWLVFIVSGTACIDYTQFWEGSSMTERIRAISPGLVLPGNSATDGFKQIIPGMNLPGQETAPVAMATHFRPFNQDTSVSFLADDSDTVGLGIRVAPSNIHGIDFKSLYPYILANGGKLPTFANNPSIGSFDPNSAVITAGLAWEKRNFNYGQNLKFINLRRRKWVDLGGGFSARNELFSGGFGIPVDIPGGGRVQWPFSGYVSSSSNDLNMQYGHSVGNVNPLGVPIKEMYPSLLSQGVGGESLPGYIGIHKRGSVNVPVVIANTGMRENLALQRRHGKAKKKN